MGLLVSYSHPRPIPNTHSKTVKCKCRQSTVEQQKNSSTGNWTSVVKIYLKILNTLFAIFWKLRSIDQNTGKYTIGILPKASVHCTTIFVQFFPTWIGVIPIYPYSYIPTPSYSHSQVGVLLSFPWDSHSHWTSHSHGHHLYYEVAKCLRASFATL